MSYLSPFYIEYHPYKAWGKLQQEDDLFALLHFGSDHRVGESHPAEIQLGLPQPGDRWLEVWRSTEPLQSGVYQQVRYRHNHTCIFGSLLIKETGAARLAQTTEAAYQQIHAALEATGFPALLRMWNFFPRINTEAQGLERYRAFCLGRHQAIESWNFVNGQLPAATAIGSRAEGLLIYFLAARQPGIQVENPRQVSAFHYPPQYGPKSPSFSRATVKNWGASQHLYISGTASIVGHATRHADESLLQLRESLANVRAVIEQAHYVHGMRCKTVADLDTLRIYIRDPAMTEDILAEVCEHTGMNCRLQLVQGDICRQDLLLELEGIFTGQVTEE